MTEGFGRPAAVPLRLEALVPSDAEEAVYELEGRDPEVMYFNVTPEMERKTAPNYDDYLRWVEQQRHARRAQLAQGDDN